MIFKPFRQVLIILVLAGLILPNFISTSSIQASFIQAADQPANDFSKVPETKNDFTSLGTRVLSVFPNAMKSAWRYAVDTWHKIMGFYKSIWGRYIFPFFENIWYKILSLFGKEVEKRKEVIPRELEKEKKEMEKETSGTGRSFWQRLNDIISE